MAQDPDPDFDAFLERRHAAAAAFVTGHEEPFLSMVSTTEGVFVNFMGTIQIGPEAVAAQYRRAAGVLRDGVYDFDTLAKGVSGDLGWMTGIQWGSKAREGQAFQPQADLRITEVYRREDGEWRLIHRHSDRLPPPAA